jgi:riboflavin kinase / FMN adenylyltransferase
MMHVFRSLAEVPSGFGPSVVTIGNFDGVHRGHQAVLADLRQRARELGGRSVVVTFDPHPMRFLHPDKAPKLITPLDLRIRLLAGTEVDAVVVLPFNRELAETSGRDFAATVLRDGLHAVEVYEGESFRFGYRAEAGIAELKQFGEEFGFGVHIHSSLVLRGIVVSSTQIRQLISKGNARQARYLLGRPFKIRSKSAHGRGIGKRLLVPTVNLAPYNELVPGSGVYVTHLRIGEEMFEAVTNVGNRPTFGEDSFAIESHILNFREMEITETTPVEVSFLHRLRGEKKWPSPEALKVQIMKDVVRARRYFALAEVLTHPYKYK